jgi:hypothetical protein
MSILDKLPLINSSNKIVKIAGYVLYTFAILIVLGAILPNNNNENANAVSATPEASSTPASDTASKEVSMSSNVLHYSNFGNYTFDGQDDVRATVKKATDIYHLMALEELPTDYGYTKDDASYTVTSTGHRIKGYIDYTSDGYVVVMQPKRSSLTKSEFMDVLNTFRRTA